jgi:lipooligosaccharide transport system permease protein
MANAPEVGEVTGDTLVVTPRGRRAGTRAHRMLERNLTIYRRIWVILFSGFFEPVFYLFAIGIGVGRLVGEVPLPSGGGVSYAAYVAPAMLAASAMNGAVFESINVFFRMRYARTYDGILATPMRPADVAIGEIAWALTRGALYAAGFVTVMLVMGLMESLWGLMALPVALLIGLGFGAVGMAAATFMKTWQDLDLIQLAILPMFLFSATFYPLQVYPPLLQTLTRLSPLYHGVELIRGFTLGVFDLSMVGHAAFLVLLALLGGVIAARRLGRLLLK